jgi:hypothetical protein
MTAETNSEAQQSTGTTPGRVAALYGLLHEMAVEMVDEYEVIDRRTDPEEARKNYIPTADIPEYLL